MFTQTLAAYSEIALKSGRVRRRMEDMLVNQIRYMLARHGLSKVKITRDRGRLFIESEDPEIACELTSKIFGIAYAMPVVKVKTSLPEIARVGTELAMKALEKGGTFAVRARRIGVHPFTSKEVEEKVGSDILSKLKGKAKVDLTRPEKTIHIEIRGEDSYISDRMMKGPGGLPVGSQGKTIVLLSGGVDSAVASWLMMKRGTLTLPVYFDNSPYWTEVHRRRVMKVARFLREFVSLADFRMTVIPMGDSLTKFIRECPRNLICVLCKRMMYRIACRLAEEKGARAIVTGESLGQVASQTLENIAVLDEVSILPVFRPLIGMNKDEIEVLARDIGVGTIAAVKVPRCGAVPPKPSTRASLKAVKEWERAVNAEGMAGEALAKAREIIL